MSNDIPSPFMETERITSQEIKTLAVFQDLQLLKLLRLVFYQKPLTNEQVKSLKEFIPKEVLPTLWKILSPKLAWDAPIFNQGVNNIWFNIRFSDLLSAEVKPIVLGTQKAVDFMDFGLKRLEAILNGANGADEFLVFIDLDMTKDYIETPSEEIKTEAVAMQKANEFLESGLLAIQGFANRKDDKDLQERVKKDSSE